MRRVWEGLGFLFLGGAIAFLLWTTVPRVVGDLRYGDGFVPAESARVTTIRCKVWGGFIANNCVIRYTLRGDPVEHEIEDFRFGWAPDGPFRLMQHRDVPARVTTDVSLATVWNRASFALVFAGFGAMLLATALGALRRRMRD